jgi:hypothetical protein
MDVPLRDMLRVYPLGLMLEAPASVPSRTACSPSLLKLNPCVPLIRLKPTDSRGAAAFTMTRTWAAAGSLPLHFRRTDRLLVLCMLAGPRTRTGS